MMSVKTNVLSVFKEVKRFAAAVLATCAFAAPALAAPALAKYCVIDLDGGTTAEKYPVEYLSDAPAGGWTDEYKTTKLVLRKIPAGAFAMGSPEGETGRSDDETQHEVTLTKDFWIGVFEVTQRQWELVMGNRPSNFRDDEYYATRPVEQVSYKNIRGATDGARWPENDKVDASSFMGTLRGKVATLKFDLPTESQWEYACRAGTTNALNSGKNVTAATVFDSCENMAQVGRYYDNCIHNASEFSTTAGGTDKVGSYEPNAWGLYDMHGNVNEWCLDWNRKTASDSSLIDPVGEISGTVRVLRGGCYGDSALGCRAAMRYSHRPAEVKGSYGLRLAASDVVFELDLVGDAAETIDARSTKRTAKPEEEIQWSGLWAGDESAEVKVFADEELLVDNLTGTGVVTWASGTAGTHTLKHETYKNGALVNTLTAEFEVPFREFVYSANDVTGVYRGREGYKITLNVTEPAEGYTIKYAESQDGPWSDDLVYVDCCEDKPMYYKLSAPNIEDKIGSALVTITKRPITLFYPKQVKVFDGKPVTFDASKLVITGDGYVTGEELSYNGFLDDDGDIGSFTDVGYFSNFFYVSDSQSAKVSNYNVTWVGAQIVITEKALTDSMVGEIADVVYTGSAHEPGVIVTDGAPSIITTDDYTVTYENNVNVGTATAVVTGKRNYTGVVRKDFNITQAMICGEGDEPGDSSLVKPEGGISKYDVKVVYDGAAHTINNQALAEVTVPECTVKIEYALDPEGPWSQEAPAWKDVVTTSVWYRVSAPNYSDFVHEARLTITKRSLTLTSPNKEKPFDDTPLTFDASEITVGGDGYAPGEEFDYSGFAAITAIGRCAAEFTIADSQTGKTSNYDIATSFGTLIVGEPIIDLPEDTREKTTIEGLKYDSAWAGVENAEVRVKINGITVLERTRGAGVINWLDSAPGEYLVTYDFFAGDELVETLEVTYTAAEENARASAQSPVAFVKTKYVVRESSEKVRVKVKRLTKKGALKLKYTTLAGTAKPGEDYYPASGELSWEDGDESTKTITIRLLPDLVNTWAEDKSFSVVLASPMVEELDENTYIAELGAMAKTLVTIKETARKSAGRTPATASGEIAPASSRAFQGVGECEVAQDGFAHEKFALINAAISSKGAISAKVKVGAKTISFRAKAANVETLSDGSLKASMYATVGIGRASLVNSLTLLIPPAGDAEAELELVMREGISTKYHVNNYAASLVADLRNEAATLEELAKWQGYYTVALPAAGSGGEQCGAGYLTLTIDKKANVKAAGKLADGTSVAISTIPGIEAGALKLPIYHGAGTAAFGGWLILQDAQVPEARVFLGASQLQWINSSANATWEMTPGGFARSLEAKGGYYNKLWNLERYYLDSILSIGGEVTLQVNGNKLAADKTSGLTLRFNRPTGIFRGKVKAPEKWAYAGVIIMNEDGIDWPGVPSTPGLGYRTRKVARPEEIDLKRSKWLESRLFTIDALDVSALNAERWAGEGCLAELPDAGEIDVDIQNLDN